MIDEDQNIEGLIDAWFKQETDRVWRQFSSLKSADALVSPTVDRTARSLANRSVVGGDVENILELLREEYESGDYLRAVAPAKVRWPPKTGQAAKRERSLGTAVWPEVRLVEYTEEAQS
jgi:hypothetical protein